MKILVSACLLGENCKYSGGNNYSKIVSNFVRGHDVIPVCPEVLGGLPTPRCPAEIVNGVVINKEGICVDQEFRRGAARAFEIAKENDVDFAILQSRSPSCGVKEIYDGTFSGSKITGQGIFAKMLMDADIRALDVEELAQMNRNDRNIHFEKIANARDLGGLQTMNGCTISLGLLLRSANLSDATEEDIIDLREKYHLSKIIDLRTETERRERPDVTMESVEYQSIPVFDESVAGISHEKKGMNEQIFSMFPKMGQLYSRMVTDPSCLEHLGKAARSVMEHDFTKGSVLWHCTEGKDRCGLLSAILLLALGADRNTIMEDYLLTNQVNGPKSEKYYQMMLAAGKAETEAEVVRNIFLAKEEYLNMAFEAIDAQYENTDTFLREGLHIPENLIEQFQKKMYKKRSK